MTSPTSGAGLPATACESAGPGRSAGAPRTATARAGRRTAKARHAPRLPASTKSTRTSLHSAQSRRATGRRQPAGAVTATFTGWRPTGAGPLASTASSFPPRSGRVAGAGPAAPHPQDRDEECDPADSTDGWPSSTHKPRVTRLLKTGSSRGATIAGCLALCRARLHARSPTTISAPPTDQPVSSTLIAKLGYSSWALPVTGAPSAKATRTYCTQSLLAVAASQVLTCMPKVVSVVRLASAKMLGVQELSVTHAVQLAPSPSTVLCNEGPNVDGSESA